MPPADRKLIHVTGLQFPLERFAVHVEPPETLLDGDFPDACGADVHQSVAAANHDPLRRLQAAIVSQPPKEDVRIEKQPQPPSPLNAFATDVGSGSSKLRLMRIRPFSAPGRRSVPPTGTSRATALPLRASTISSPASTRSRRRDRCVLASWTLTVFI